jgi:hypothetical protein
VATDRLEDAQHVARREAAPFVLVAAAADIVLAVASHRYGWRLFERDDWWFWLVLAFPAVLLAGVFALGLGRLGVSSVHRREAAVGLLALMVAANLVAIGLVIGSLLSGGPAMKPGQLLLSAFVVLTVNMISFGLVFWELDSGGPVRRTLAERRHHPDFQFPQDENPGLAAPAWKPGLGDYVYLALTNSIAFSPTDAMPLSHRAKLLMGIQSLVAVVTVLVVAARAVNILN